MHGFHLIGASVRGEAHAAQGRECEDAFHCRRSAGGLFVAAADGVGSCAHARAGARAAVRAAADAAHLWRGEPAQVSDVVKLLHANWRLRLHPHAPSAASATCLFAVAWEQTTLVAQLGDGLAAWAEREDGARRLEPETTRAFCNETASLASARSPEEWTTTVLPFVPHTLVLATDGVADDLKPDSDETLLAYFGELATDRGIAHARLSRDLRNWTTPGATDDRTIAGWTRDTGGK